MAENHRQRSHLSPWSNYTEVVLGGAPIPTLEEDAEKARPLACPSARKKAKACLASHAAPDTRTRTRTQAPTADADADADDAMEAPAAASGPGGAVSYAADSPVTFASRPGPEGLPVGVLYNGTAVKNATEARLVDETRAMRNTALLACAC